MIILMSNSKENRAAATNLHQLTHFDALALDQLTDLNKAKEQLLLVDVDANDKFLRYLEPVSFAEALLKHQLSDQVHSVVFLISDNNRHKNLFEFARPFLARLEQAFNHQVIAYIPSDLNYYATVLMAPDEQNSNWQVYGIDIADFPKETSLNLERFQRIKGKHLLWEGSNILEWLVTENKTISSSPAVPDNLRFHL
ncbi:hypothetical protein OQJ19_07540 [Fluoribacter gormanii]|uniref:Uncharacterized protein n=1 Tax=Fluoribacter gormanii TaxID=464 RepID=A0A377GPV0_9GAMM|nr:hypothetical protein [Fluoribacter gormanii]KTD03864.1 hypothetical protein Lgor_1133 [Fluoribacter gormanii]MCW8445298.1 hypothetical protein [Fluoribacter gormanii]MCW8470503.1 hypothetical protein [Fluoribacter gormanii]SIR86483.1 hypothetical protein SAMN05421777_1324 [Fluoribacter gormanii]STO26342.1 Uncharacterised protein [Fluoribacter gormanii]